MGMESVGQLQALNRLMKEQLSYAPAETVMILGVARGNGLEHIDPAVVKAVYGVDVNGHYLSACKERYPRLSGMFQPIQTDLETEGLVLPQVQLLIADLLVEYIGCPRFRTVVEMAKPGRVSCVIQQEAEKEDGFVTRSPYQRAFDGLEHIHHTITVQELSDCLETIGYSCERRQDYPLASGKKLVRLEFRKLQSIVMDSRKMENPDLDIRYTLPDRIEEWSRGVVQDNGYDYVDEEGHVLALWLKTEDAEGWWPKLVELMKTERFEDNDLSQSAAVLVSQKPNAELDQCRQVWPEERKEEAL